MGQRRVFGPLVGWCALALSLVMAGCASAGASSASGHTIQVVAGENFWGSLASQLGGTHASVQSIVTNPNTDPHEYESSAGDARAIADADLVILNGAGYDAWGRKLLSANPSRGRQVLVVAELLGKKEGDNPHFWYDPTAVDEVADQITARFQAIDSQDTSAFARQREALRTALTPYREVIAHIRSARTGTPVGSTETIFVYMAQALGLNLISPPDFMQAISEGNDPPAQSVAAIQDQISQHRIKALVYNRQTSTAITDNLKRMATKNGIPVVGISETVQPPTASFQDWQLAQLNDLQAALGRQ